MSSGDHECQNLVPIDVYDVEIYEWKCGPAGGARGKVSRMHPLGAMNFCTKLHTSNSWWDISVWIKLVKSLKKNLFPTISTDLTCGRLFSRLREMAPEPHPTSKHVCWASSCFISRSVSTSSTNSCTHTQRKNTALVMCDWSLGFHCAPCACVACFSPV